MAEFLIHHRKIDLGLILDSIYLETIDFEFVRNLAGQNDLQNLIHFDSF